MKCPAIDLYTDLLQVQFSCWDHVYSLHKTSWYLSTSLYFKVRLTHDLWKLSENVLEKERLKVTHAVSTLFSFLRCSSLIYWGFFFSSEFPCLFFPCNLIVPWHLLNIWPHGPLLFFLIHCYHLVLKSWLPVLTFPSFFLLLFLIYPYCCYCHHSTSFLLLVTLVDRWAPVSLGLQSIFRTCISLEFTQLLSCKAGNKLIRTVRTVIFNQKKGCTDFPVGYATEVVAGRSVIW